MHDEVKTIEPRATIQPLRYMITYEHVVIMNMLGL